MTFSTLSSTFLKFDGFLGSPRHSLICCIIWCKLWLGNAMANSLLHGFAILLNRHIWKVTIVKMDFDRGTGVLPVPRLSISLPSGSVDYTVLLACQALAPSCCRRPCPSAGRSEEPSICCRNGPSYSWAKNNEFQEFQRNS